MIVKLVCWLGLSALTGMGLPHAGQGTGVSGGGARAGVCRGADPFTPSWRSDPWRPPGHFADSGWMTTAACTPSWRRKAAAARCGGEQLRPFAWVTDEENPGGDGIVFERLKGDGFFTRLVHAETLAQFEAWQAAAKAAGAKGADVVRPLESQWLLQTRARLFADLPYARLRRCQLDIETSSADGGF